MGAMMDPFQIFVPGYLRNTYLSLSPLAAGYRPLTSYEFYIADFSK
jgi:hypothetical protein